MALGGGGMLSRFTGVGGALSDLGREIPRGETQGLKEETALVHSNSSLKIHYKANW